MPGLHSRLSNDETEVVEEQPAVPEEQHFNNENVLRFPMGKHMWRQEGPYLVCRTCELNHALYIGMDKIMVGEENDKPIIKSRQEVFGTK